MPSVIGTAGGPPKCLGAPAALAVQGRNAVLTRFAVVAAVSEGEKIA